MKKTLIIGGGYLGSRLVDHFVSLGEVTVITRSTARHNSLKNLGAQVEALDISNSRFHYNFSQFDTIIFCPAVTIDRTKKTAKRNLYIYGLTQIIRQAERQKFIGTFLVVGSTSCFLNRESFASTQPDPFNPQHFLVNENSLAQNPDPSNPSWRQFDLWEKYHGKLPFTFHLLISSGIYGPGRHPAKKVLQGLKITHKNPHQWINLIHVEDLKGAIIWTLNQNFPSQLFCVSNNKALTLREFYGIYTSVLQLNPIEFSATSSDQHSGKIVSSKKIQDLGFQLIHPNFNSSFVYSQLKELAQDLPYTSHS